MSSPVVDAVVIGAGPSGLVAANMLADAGWDVVLLEAAATPGGAGRSAEVAATGDASGRRSWIDAPYLTGTWSAPAACPRSCWPTCADSATTGPR